MNKFSIALISLFLPIMMSAQVTQQVTNKLGDKYNKSEEVYNVLSSDMTTREGLYELSRNNHVMLRGYYKSGAKDSVWESYPNGNAVLARRWYASGVKKSIWEFYTAKGDPEWQYDFTTGTATYAIDAVKPADTATYYYMTGTGEWPRGHLTIPPLRLNSQGEWLRFLNRTLRYPDEAIEKNEQGMATVAIIIDENGTPGNYVVLYGVSPALDYEALRVVKLCDFDYLPAEKDGKKIKSAYLQPITFKLERGN
jgi:TonB family protein